MKQPFHESIICAGFGGQGIMLLGKLLAQAGMDCGYHVTWMPSYGAEVRGGTAHSMVKISTKHIASPLVYRPDTCIAMNKQSLERFIGRVKPAGIVIANTSMTGGLPPKKGIKVIGLPLTDMASDIGNIKVANTIALGAYARIKKFLSLENITKSLEETFKEKPALLAANKKALEKGFNTSEVGTHSHLGGGNG